jgi:hypothetical protein
MNKEQIESLVQFINRTSPTTYVYDIRKSVIKWFDQNPQEQVAVGLSDEQLSSLWHNTPMWREYGDFHSAYHAWEKTQTFILQPFTPDWNDAPLKATSCQIKLVWIDKHGSALDYKLLLDQQRPTPLVEVGQIWKLNPRLSESEFEVKTVGSFNVDSEECKGVHVFGDGTNYFFSLNEFLTKFKRVN